MKKIFSAYALLFLSLGLNAQDTLKPFSEANKWGYKNSKGVVINCKYDQANPFSEGFASVKSMGKWGFIDQTGKEITAFKYDPSYDGSKDYAFYSFAEGMAAVRSAGKWGFINTSGKEVIPLTYFHAENFHKGSAEILTSAKKRIYINSAGQNILTKPYEFVNEFYDDLAQVTLYKKCGYINRIGKEVIPCKYEYGFDFKNGFAWVQLNDKWGLIDSLGKEVIPFKYNKTMDFSEGLAEVQEDDGGPWGFINYKGEVIIPLEYDRTFFFDRGKALARKDGLWGVIDKEGKVLVPFKYEDGGIDEITMGMIHKCFGEGMKVMMLNGKFGYVDINTGKEVIPFKFDKAWEFAGCCADAILNTKRGKIDKKGKFTPDK